MRAAQSADRGDVGRPAARVVHTVEPFWGRTAGGVVVVVGVPGRGGAVEAPRGGTQAPRAARSRMVQARRFTRSSLRSMTASAVRRPELECRHRRVRLV